MTTSSDKLIFETSLSSCLSLMQRSLLVLPGWKLAMSCGEDSSQPSIRVGVKHVSLSVGMEHVFWINSTQCRWPE